MKARRKWVVPLFSFAAAVALGALVCTGCGGLTIPGLPTPQPGARMLYVLNTLAQTVSAIDLNTGEVQNNVFSTGTWPNQIVVRNNLAYVVNSGDNNIQVVDLSTYSTTATIDLGAGANPYAILPVSDNKAYVSNLLANTVAVVNLVAGTVIKTIAVGMAPEGLAFARGKIYVANTGFTGSGYTQGTVSVIDSATDQVTAAIAVGTNPQVIANAPDGTLHVLCTGDYGQVCGCVYVIDPQTDAVVGQPIDLGGSPTTLLIVPGGKGYFAGFGGPIGTYDTATGEVSREAIAVQGGASGATYARGTAYFTVFSEDTVLAVDVATDQIVATYAVGDGPLSPAVRSKRRAAFPLAAR